MNYPLGTWENVYLKIQLYHTWVRTQRILYPTTDELTHLFSVMLYSEYPDIGNSVDIYQLMND